MTAKKGHINDQMLIFNLNLVKELILFRKKSSNFKQFEYDVNKKHLLYLRTQKSRRIVGCSLECLDMIKDMYLFAKNNFEKDKKEIIEYTEYGLPVCRYHFNYDNQMIITYYDYLPYILNNKQFLPFNIFFEEEAGKKYVHTDTYFSISFHFCRTDTFRDSAILRGGMEH